MILLQSIKTFYNNVKPFGENIHKMDARKIFVFSFPIVVMLFAYSFITFFILKKPVLAFWEIGCALLAFSSNLIYKKTRNFRLSAHFLVFSGLLTLSIISFYTGGVQGSVIFWIYLCPLCAGMIIDRKAILVWGGISISIVLGFMFFNESIQQFPGVISDANILAAFKQRTIFGTIAFSMLMGFIYKSLVDMAVNEARDQQSHVRNLLRLVTHDIGNSLALIDMSSKVMQKEGIDLDKKNGLWIKHRLGVDNIVGILNQVREMEAVKSGKRKIELSSVNLGSVIETSFLIFEDQLLKKNLTLEVDNQLTNNEHVIAEPISLSNQVLNNLISNSIKFSKRGDTINVNLFSEGEFCVVEVKDSGVGIDEETLKNIFDPSEKTSHEGTEGEKGTGFGMPLMKMFVEKYDGEITIEGRTQEQFPNDHGTTIKIYLKFAVTECEEKNRSI